MANSGTSHPTRALWLVGLLHAFTHVYTVCLLPLFLAIQRDLGLTSVAQSTLLATIMGLAYVLPSYPMGVLADRFSRKKLLAAGLAINALGFIGLALSPNYAAAVGFSVLAGLGGSFYHPSATAMIARVFPHARGRALGLTGIGASAGFFFGPIYSGWRATISGSWRAPVLELGIAGLVGALVFLWLAEEDKQQADAPAEAAARTKIPMFGAATLWFFFLGAALLLSMRDFAGQAMGTASSLFLQNAHGYAPKMAGIALSCVFIMSAISNPLFGHLSDRGRLRWATVVLACGALLAAAVPHLRVNFVIPAFLAYGFFFMASYPIVEAGLMESVPDAVRGRVFGLFITIGGLIGNFSHWAVGEWVSALGQRAASASAYNPMFALIGVLILASLGSFPFLHALRKAERIDKPDALPDTTPHTI